MDSKPLEGLKIVGFSTMISAPFATNLMADFGADVISVEHPDMPDALRAWSPEYENKSLWWKSMARNKRCITLDLSDPEGQELALELVEDADIVFENFRPGTMEKWNLGYEDLREVNPGVIMTRISGYGQTGPDSEKPGFGTIAEAFSGFANSNGFPDSDPLLPPIPLADLTAAQFAVFSTMFAVYERDVIGSGEGQVIDVSLYESLFRIMIAKAEAYDALGETSKRTGNRSDTAVPRNLYRTSDGYIVLSASSQRIFKNVMRAIGREDLIDDPRFETNSKRLENVEELDSIIEDWTKKRTTEEAISVMEGEDAIVGPVYDEADIFEDDQYQARDALIEVDDPSVGELTVPNAVPFFTRTPGEVEHLGPDHGEHNESVYLDDLDMDSDRFKQLREDGII